MKETKEAVVQTETETRQSIVYTRTSLVPRTLPSINNHWTGKASIRLYCEYCTIIVNIPHVCSCDSVFDISAGLATTTICFQHIASLAYCFLGKKDNTYGLRCNQTTSSYCIATTPLATCIYCILHFFAVSLTAMQTIVYFLGFLEILIAISTIAVCSFLFYLLSKTRLLHTAFRYHSLSLVQ